MNYKIIILISLFSLNVLHGQTREVACRFMYFGAKGALPKVFAVSPEGGHVPCITPTAAFSPVKPFIVSQNTLRLVTEDKQTLANSQIPETSSSVFIVIIQTAHEPKPAWRTYVVDDNPKNFPPGGAFVVNFNPGDIRFIIGEHKGALKRATSHGYTMPEKRDDFNMAPVQFWIETDGEWRCANESALRFLPEVRYMFIAYTEPNSNRPRLHTVSDQ